MKQIFVSGSSAYDNIYHTDKHFWDELSQHISFVSRNYVKHHGGTGANIAYNLALLGEHSILYTAIWSDYDFSHLIKEKINLKYVHKDREEHSAHVNIIVDSAWNRMGCYHPGAMKNAHESKVEYIEEALWVAIVSAWDIRTMLEHARWLNKRGVKLIIDPAQQIDVMSKEELEEFLQLWDILICNNDEYNSIKSISQLEDSQLKEMFEAIIITYSENGSKIVEMSQETKIPAITVGEVDDTTGAGDAYRAWLLYGIIEGWKLEKSCKLWSLLASYCLLAPGSQQHHVSYGTIAEEMKSYFNEEVDLYQRRKY